MKKTLVLIAPAMMLLFACKTSQVSSFNDDIYTSPAEERALARAAADQKAKQLADERAKREEQALAQKIKDDNNPYYQDPKSGADDYYDYKYASRINRFDNPIYGAGYYDTRYTNYYTYNQNPAFYGSSIYSSYSWMPSNQFYGYSTGLGMTIGSGYGYNSYSYASPFCGSPYYAGYTAYPASPYCSPYNNFGFYGYNPYSAGFYNGYTAGYYSGYNGGFYNNNYMWTYLNSYDPNSGYGHMQYGPRESNGGGNSSRRSSAGVGADEDSPRSRFFQSMAEKQQNTPRFTEVPRHARSANVPGTIEPTNGQAGAVNPQSGRARETRQNSIWSPSGNGNRAANENGGNNPGQGNTASPRGGRATEARESSIWNSTGNTSRSSGEGGNNSGNQSNSGSGNGSRGSNQSGSGPRGGSGGGNSHR